MSFNKSFEEFYRKYQPSLVGYANYLIYSKEDAIEIVNDVFVAIWNKKDTLEIGDALKSYLYTSVKNKCINFIQKKKIEYSELKDYEGAGDLFADNKINAQEGVASVNKITNMLPPKCKQVFMMSRVDGLSYKEIAGLLDISIKTVENQISKALKIFRKNLKLE